jgi:hypothetical protein
MGTFFQRQGGRARGEHGDVLCPIAATRSAATTRAGGNPRIALARLWLRRIRADITMFLD